MASPAPPVRRVLFAVVAPIQQFFRREAAGGLVLVFSACLALVLANSPLGEVYGSVIHTTVRFAVGSHEATLSLHTLINDVLMTAFFVVAGMEIKREVATGELRSFRRAALPLIAAAGGMIAPALVYLAINSAGPARVGWAIPTATDIAFALGCLSLVKQRVPWSLFVFLTALAIFDDLGAILVIAFSYGGKIDVRSLIAAIAVAFLLLGFARARIRSVWPYVVVGACLWVFVARAGLHPTLAGVIVGLSIPASSERSVGDALEDLDIALESLRQLPTTHAEGSLVALEQHVRSLQPPIERLLHRLHGPVAFGIVPLFALANAGIPVSAEARVALHPVTIGVAAGLVAGKCAGVLSAIFFAVRLRIASLPSDARWVHIVGISLMAGIGFTMSLFVTGLAFPEDPATAMAAKVGILGGSVMSSLAGLGVLWFSWRPGSRTTAPEEISVLHIDLPRFAEGYRVSSWRTTGPLVGRTLASAALRRDHGVTVLGVFREPAEKAAEGMRFRKLEAIGPDYTLTDGETLLVVGEREHVERFIADDGKSAAKAGSARESLDDE